MKLKFSIEYKTMWGEGLHVVVTYTAQDGNKRSFDLPMQTEDGQHWILETTAIESRHHPISCFTHIYKVEDNEGNVLRTEWDLVPRSFSFDASKDYIMPDAWRDYPIQSHLYTDAYKITRCLPINERLMPLAVPLFRRTLLFRVSAPQLLPQQSLAVCGSHPALGSWSTSRYLQMQYEGSQEWILSVNVDGILQAPLEYKYVIVDNDTHNVLKWEEGDNRRIEDCRLLGDGQVMVLDGGVLRICEEMWRMAGVAIPVFSLRSNHSYGVGDFGDLRRMVDWAVDTGMTIIQLLPVNDTTHQHSWMDSSPYAAISVFALHPHYVDLEAAGILKDGEKMTNYHRQQREINALGFSDYEAVDKVKQAYLHDLYVEQCKSVCASAEFHAFVESNKEWLLPYAAFCLFREKYHTAHYLDWEGWATYDEKAVSTYLKTHEMEAGYIYYVQYLLHRQLKEVSDYACKHGVALMGDVAISVCHDSVDAWMTPQYFYLDAQVGTPPDKTSPNGQVWGMPSYNWDAMMADDCQWWHSRLHHLSSYFSAIRLDHVLGFFRMWEMPMDAVCGLLGYFSSSLPLTPEEIEYFGLHFRHQMLTRPFINDKVVNRLFGIHAQYVREHFLVPKDYGLYDLVSEVDSQRKIRQYFKDKRDENSLWIRDGLYRLVANVLFVEDKRHRGMYHPRVNAFCEPVYEALDTEDKEAYMRLYNHYYYHRHNQYWRLLGLCRLSVALRGCKMLVCAEDLGLLPGCVGEVLDELRILTTELQTMPKQGDFEFVHLNSYPYRSMAVTSTHDMAPLRLWWDDNPESVQRFYVTMLQKEGRAPRHLPAPIAEEIIARHLYSPSMLCVLPYQDWMALSTEGFSGDLRCERINTPGDAYNRWKYRMASTIEKLCSDEPLNKKIKMMIKRSKR